MVFCLENNKEVAECLAAAISFSLLKNPHQFMAKLEVTSVTSSIHTDSTASKDPFFMIFHPKKADMESKKVSDPLDFRTLHLTIEKYKKHRKKKNSVCCKGSFF